jgi:hypothetical protein
MTSLVSINDGWLVSYDHTNEHSRPSKKFITIELAADFLLSLGIDDEEIDAALIAIHSDSLTRRANFNKDGKLYSTDIF